jgi:NodT family efflux transporter outer membrane factor (OMF) lipoprotein
MYQLWKIRRADASRPRFTLELLPGGPVARHTVMLLLAPLLAAACTVGPTYQTPPIPVEGAYEPAAAATTQAAASNAAWWSSLNDKRLDALIATATANNLDLRQAQTRIREARAQRALVAGQDLPTLNASGLYQYDRLSQNAAPYNAFNVPGFPWEYNTYQAGFDASWEIDLFGGNRRAVEAATDNLQATQESRSAVLVSLQGEVARNYVDLRGFQQQRILAQHNLELQSQTLAITRDRVKNGVGSDLDVSRASAQVAATAAEIPLFERGEWQSLHRLAVLTHQPLDKLLPLHEVAPIPEAGDAVLVGVPADLLRRRPDIRRAERELAAATARVGVATAELYPKLSLTGFFDLQSESVDDFFDWHSRMFALGPTVTWRIFEGGRLHAAIEMRSAQQEAALLSYEQTVQTSIQEVRDQVVGLSTERRRRAALADAVASNLDAADLAGKLYVQGLTDFLNVLDAQRQLNLAQNALARSDIQIDQALIALYKALGGGWQVDKAPAAK